MPTENHELFSHYDFSNIENMWLRLVLDVIHTMIENREACDCEDCVLDLTALALNILPPKYWVSGKYNEFSPPDRFLQDPKNRKRAQEAVEKALGQIKKNPHHL